MHTFAAFRMRMQGDKPLTLATDMEFLIMSGSQHTHSAPQPASGDKPEVLAMDAPPPAPKPIETEDSAAVKAEEKCKQGDQDLAGGDNASGVKKKKQAKKGKGHWAKEKPR
jgi:hypothetical protein